LRWAPPRTSLGAPLSSFQLMVLTLAAALPSASNVSLLAERYGRRQRPRGPHHHDQHGAGLCQLSAAGLAVWGAAGLIPVAGVSAN
jgi:hypothetical protein